MISSSLHSAEHASVLERRRLLVLQVRRVLLVDFVPKATSPPILCRVGLQLWPLSTDVQVLGVVSALDRRPGVVLGGRIAVLGKTGGHIHHLIGVPCIAFLVLSRMKLP